MSNVIPFISKGSKKTTDGEILDHGKISTVEYEIYKRGVIHVFDKNHRFKKDITAFETEIENIDFAKLSNGESLFIAGSGDNDDLCFTKKDGDISISFKKKGFKTIEKLKEILNGTKHKTAAS